MQKRKGTAKWNVPFYSLNLKHTSSSIRSSLDISNGPSATFPTVNVPSLNF